MSDEIAKTEDRLSATGLEGGWFTLVLAILFSIVLIALYHFWLAKPAAGFAVVDINSVVKIKEAEFTALLSRPGVGDRDRIAAYQLVSQMGPQIDRAVGELQKDCACTILVKSAVIAGPAEDLTAQLKEKLGMAKTTEGKS
jgi:hypothetical protein